MVVQQQWARRTQLNEEKKQMETEIKEIEKRYGIKISNLWNKTFSGKEGKDNKRQSNDANLQDVSINNAPSRI